jgi:actin-related protein
LLKDRSEPELKELKDEAVEKLKVKAEKKEEKEKVKEKKSQNIAEYCENRKWKLLKRDQPLPEGAELKLVDGKLSLPIMIVYPEFGQFDLIASSFEDQKVREHFKELMEQGLPWDAKG